MSPRVCPECGGSEIAQGLRLDQTADAGHIGLSYKAAAIFRATEPLCADLCLKCGTVMRLFVKNPDRKWVQ